MQAIRLRRAWWGGFGVVMLLAAGCAAAESGTAQADSGNLSVTVTTPAETTSAAGPAQPATESESPTESGPTAGPAQTTDSSTAPQNTSGSSAACADTSGWDTADKKADLTGNEPITAIDAGADACVERFVITLRTGAHEPGYLVRYVDAIVQDGSGLEVPVEGDAKLEVIIDSPAYDPETGQGTLQIPDHDHAVDVEKTDGFDAIEQIAFAGSFEGQTTFGLGLDRKLPFSVTAEPDADGNMTLTVTVPHE